MRGMKNPVKILVVEDSRTQAEMLKNTLEKHGYTVTLAENGRSALDILDSVNPDVIISDVVMPVMDGYEFCRTVKNDERYRHIPVILLTMLTDSKDVIYAMVSGADNFITKPYQGEYLVSRLKKIISQKKALAASTPAEPPMEFSVIRKKIFHLPQPPADHRTPAVGVRSCGAPAPGSPDCPEKACRCQ